MPRVQQACSWARVIALSATLNKACGVSYERIERLLGAVFALRVNRSSINRAVCGWLGLLSRSPKR